MIEVTKDLCVYCLSKATIVRETGRFIVGLCDDHKDLDNKDIDEIIGYFKSKSKGKGLKALLRDDNTK